MSAPCPTFGFTIVITLRETTTDREADRLIGRLMELLEANGLSMGGGAGRVFEFVVTRDGAQATNADRQLVADWAERQTALATIRVSDIVDVDEE